MKFDGLIASILCNSYKMLKKNCSKIETVILFFFAKLIDFPVKLTKFHQSVLNKLLPIFI